MKTKSFSYFFKQEKWLMMPSTHVQTFYSLMKKLLRLESSNLGLETHGISSFHKLNKQSQSHTQTNNQHKIKQSNLINKKN